MDRKIEIGIIASVIAIMLIIGIIAIVTINSSPDEEIGHEEEHDHDHEENAMDHFIEHISNWMIWVIFAITLISGIIIFFSLKKK